MKKGILWMLIICSSVQINAQSSQVKLYLQQIAANKVLIEYIGNSYKMARRGLTIIADIKQGDFNLHRDFFASLKGIIQK